MPTVITKNQGKYLFHYQQKIYPFTLFSEENLQTVDKKRLESEERARYSFIRTLTLACSMDLLEAKVALGNTCLEMSNIIILYKENGIEKVADYQNNLVMKKEDYYEIFAFQEISVVDKFDLYQIYDVMMHLDDDTSLLEYLLYKEEKIQELSKREEFKYLGDKYNAIGINSRNQIVLGGHHFDCLFFCEEDCHHMKQQHVIDELKNFTEDPSQNTEHIIYDEEKKQYKFEDEEAGVFYFGLLSDRIVEEEIRKELLSDNRYHHCHRNAHVVAKRLNKKDKEFSYIVGGKFKENETDYLYHSWVEIDNKNVVIDYNYNLEMDRDKYYQLFEVEVISKTLVSKMKEIVSTVVFDADIPFSSMDLNYFGEELLQDVKKNEKIFTKRRNERKQVL